MAVKRKTKPKAKVRLRRGKQPSILKEEGYSIIGKPIPRVDARAKVTGEAKYAADIEVADMLWGAIKRSPYPHARILTYRYEQGGKITRSKSSDHGEGLRRFQMGLEPGDPG